MIHTYLRNGSEVAIKSSDVSELVAIQCWVGVGSINESDAEQGIAHYIEHMLFKGTARRKVGEIAATVETCGGDINAYTTFDRTVYYLTLNSKYLSMGLDLLSDAIYNSSFDLDEVNKEREVICEEIKRYADKPSSMMAQKIFGHVFANTQASRPIIGSQQSVKGFSRDDLINFHAKWYTPQNISVVIVGNFDENEALRLTEQYFVRPSDVDVEIKTRVEKQRQRRTFPSNVVVELIKGDYQQPRLEVAFEAPSYDMFDAVALDVASFVLGAGDAARLNRVLKESEGVVSSIAASIYAPMFGGIFELSSYPILECFESALSSMIRETLKLKYTNSITEQELNRARANLKSGRVFQEETVYGQAKTIGFGLTTPHKYLHESVYQSLVDGVGAEEIHLAMSRWIDTAKVVIVGLVPETSPLTTKDLEKAYWDGVSQAKSHKVKTNTGATKIRQSQSMKPHVIEINPRLKLIYKHKPSSDVFCLTAVSEGGLRAENDSNSGLYNAISGLLAKSSDRYSYDDILERVEGCGASIDGFSGKDSFGFRLQSLKEYAFDMLDILSDCFLHPVFPKEQWDILKTEILEDINSQDDSPSQICMRKFRELIYNNHPYKYPVYGRKSSVESFNHKLLQKEYVKLRDSGSWILGCAGGVDVKELEKYLQDRFATWLSTMPQRSKIKNTVESSSNQSVHIQKDREQTHIALGVLGVDWHNKHRAALDVMSNILGGQGGRLFCNLRDNASLAYSVSPLLNFGCDQGIIGAYIACAPSKKEEACKALCDELFRFKTELCSEAELQRSINYIVGGQYEELQRSDTQAMNMALMELYGVGYDDAFSYPKVIEKVTALDIQKAAIELLDENKLVVVSVGNSTK